MEISSNLATVARQHIPVHQNFFSEYSFRLTDDRVHAFTFQGAPVYGGLSLFDIDATARKQDCFKGWVRVQTIEYVQLTLEEAVWSALLASTGLRSYPRGARPHCYRCCLRYDGFITCPRCSEAQAAALQKLAGRLLC